MKEDKKCKSKLNFILFERGGKKKGDAGLVFVQASAVTFKSCQWRNAKLTHVVLQALHEIIKYLKGAVAPLKLILYSLS